METFSVFALDNWQITPTINLTYGLRWELTPPPTFGAPGTPSTGDAISGPTQAGTLPVPAPLPVAVPLAMDATTPAWRTRYTQFAPRLGVVHRLNKEGTFILRAGAGLFYDLSFPSSIDLLNGSPYNRWRLVTVAAAPSPDSTLGFARDLKLPYSVQWSTAMERRLADKTVVAAVYAGSAGRNLLRREGIMASPPQEPTSVTATNNGSSNYHSLQIQVRRPFGKSFQGNLSYTWSHAIDNGSWDSAVFLLYPGTPRNGDRGSSDFDVRHSLQAAFLYRLPSMGPDSRLVEPLRHWALSGVFRARAGFPIDVIGSENQFGLAFDNAPRPNRAPDTPLWIADGGVPGGKRLNPAAFRTAPLGEQGNLGRNAIRGFGVAQLDLALQREFHAGETLRIQARLEGYNVTNTSRFGDPRRYLDSALFGQATSMLNLMMGAGRPSSGLTPAFQTGGARTVQLSVRVQF
jgi:hypothetical protein